MNFEEIIYKRPNIESFEDQIEEYLKEFKLAKSFDEQVKIIESINVLRNELLTAITVAETRYMININDEEYKKELENIEKIWLEYQEIIPKYYKVLIESKYIADLEEGNAWHLQTHIYRYPFYSINYNLAQLCALQFFNRAEEDRTKAWEEYVQLCELGGSKSFVELIDSCNMISPFEEAAFINASKVVEKHMDKIDDLNF
jgi:oligoendopeptidase F